MKCIVNDKSNISYNKRENYLQLEQNLIALLKYVLQKDLEATRKNASPLKNYMIRGKIMSELMYKVSH